ncbi:MAG: carbohydrate binding domain-containing protein [Armatimonadetes bacterium]|nr:carbohydrate binding domain-containing protein [Armatimonadota bacterium]
MRVSTALVLLLVVTVLASLAIMSLAQAQQARQVKLIGDFESQADLATWRAGNGARPDLVADHATRGQKALHLSFPEGHGLIRLQGPLDWSGWELLKIDVFNPGDPFTMTFRADDASGQTISSWYHLVRTGASTLDISVRGLAEGIDLGQIAWVHLRVDPARPKPCEVYVDNWRLTKGMGLEIWRPQVPPEQRPVKKDPTNLLDNGDFELGLQGWGSWGLWDGGEYRFGSGTGQKAYSGRHSAAIYCVKQGRGGIFTSPFTVPAAATYTLRVMAKGAQPGDILFSYEGKKAQQYKQARVSTDWQQFSLTVDVPAGDQGRVYLYSRSDATVFYDAAYFGAPGVTRPQAALPSGTPPKVTTRGDKVFINGKPFFCRGIYRATPADLKGTAFNFIPGWDLRGKVGEAAPGLWLMPDLSGLARAHLLYQLPLAIEPLRRLPQVIGWYVCDEPDHEKWPVGPDELKYATRLVHQKDPGRLTMTVVMPWAASNLYRFADSVDILATDSYPITKNKPSPVLRVAQATDWACRATRKAKPVWLVVQATSQATWEEETAVTYLALTHGANGILYWEYEDGHRNPEIWRTITALVEEMRALEPALTSPDAATQAAPSNRQIHCLTKQAPDGLYVLAINATDHPVTAVSLSLGQGQVADGKAEVQFEGRRVPVRGGVLRDDFGPYQRHVYKLAAAAEGK